MTTPINTAAVLEKTGQKLVITSRPIPVPGPDEILVRNKAVAGNPADWMIQSYGGFTQNYPTVVGSDVCGIIQAIGSSVTKFHPGDRVFGFGGMIYKDNGDHGAWQTYTLLREISCTRLPDSMSFEEGATFPMAFATAAISLVVALQVPRPESVQTAVKERKEGFLVWGGASSVGTAMIQLARLAGFKVFVTASKKHHAYLKTLGAYAAADYREEDVVSQIVAAAKEAGTSISLGFDAAAKRSTLTNSADILLTSGGKGAKLAVVQNWPEDLKKPDGLETFFTFAAQVGMTHPEVGAWLFNDYLKQTLESKAIVPAPEIEIVEGGIGAAQSVLDRLKEGVSGKKLVVRVA